MSVTDWIIVGLALAGFIAFVRLSIRWAEEQEWKDRHCPDCGAEYGAYKDEDVISRSIACTVYVARCPNCGLQEAKCNVNAAMTNFSVWQ